MSVSKVTLLGKPGSTYTIMYGSRDYMFAAGYPRKVPVAIALEARKRKDGKGQPLFGVEDLPEIVQPAPPPATKTIDQAGHQKGQNVPAEAQQPTFGI
jgi:hypothetical protein